MAIDQRLMMGIIFIVAGVALALLAYAAFLYRRAPTELGQAADFPDEDEDRSLTEMEDALDEEQQTSDAEPLSGTAGQEVELEAQEESEAAIPEPEIAQAGPSATEQVPHEISHEAESLDQHGGMIDAAEEVAVETESDPSGATVNLRLDPETGRLKVQIGEQAFSSAQELRDSQLWKQVAPILRDTVAWLTLADSQRQPDQKQRETAAPETGSSHAFSMVEQINQVLERKLDRGEISTRAVRLVEGEAGSIRVYIGVDSYSIDEVPDAEVKRVIREAVAEWESQQ